MENLREKISDLENNYKYLRQEKAENEVLFSEKVRKNQKLIENKNKDIPTETTSTYSLSSVDELDITISMAGKNIKKISYKDRQLLRIKNI